MDSELEELVLKKSVGNPFFCTEFVAHLTQSDMLEVVEEKVKLRADKKAILNQVSGGFLWNVEFSKRMEVLTLLTGPIDRREADFVSY